MKKYRAKGNMEVGVFTKTERGIDNRSIEYYIKRGEILDIYEIFSRTYAIDGKSELNDYRTGSFKDFPDYFEEVKDDYIHVSTEIIEKKDNSEK